MKEILKRLFNHEELTREEACSLMKNITGEKYNNTQIASLLTVFQMRGITVEELIGFREAAPQHTCQCRFERIQTNRHSRHGRRRQEHIQYLHMRLLRSGRSRI